MDNSFKLKALIDLLDDPDSEVFSAVSEQIVTQGVGVVPDLERAWEISNNEIVQTRIEDLIQTINFNQIADSLVKWANSEKKDLLIGAYLAAKVVYPNIELAPINEKIEKLRWDTWIELNDNQTALEKVRIINHLFFDVEKYTSSKPVTPSSYFINNFIENKQGSPNIITIFYGIVAQKLNLPIYPVSLPKNFVLAYQSSYHPNYNDPRSILFYINPFNNGAIFGRHDIENFLQKEGIEVEDKYLLPCSNIRAIELLFSNISYASKAQGNKKQSTLFQKLSDIIKDYN